MEKLARYELSERENRALNRVAGPSSSDDDSRPLDGGARRRRPPFAAPERTLTMTDDNEPSDEPDALLMPSQVARLFRVASEHRFASAEGERRSFRDDAPNAPRSAEATKAVEAAR